MYLSGRFSLPLLINLYLWHCGVNLNLGSSQEINFELLQLHSLPLSLSSAASKFITGGGITSKLF